MTNVVSKIVHGSEELASPFSPHRDATALLANRARNAGAPCGPHWQRVGVWRWEQCGGNGGGGGTINPGTTAGTYAITVTGTSGSTTAMGTFPLNLQ
jgi:hypothetical protein